MPIQLDIRTGVQTAVIILGVFAVLSLFLGVRGLIGARSLRFYRMRRDRIVKGWRRLIISLVFFASGFLIYTYAEPIAYQFYPPTETPTITPSITTTPTISLTPTITETPTITPTPEKSHTPTITLTPHIPLAVEAQFEGSLAVPENAAFSRLEFTSEGLDALYRPIEPSTVFTNPIGTMYAVFSYDGMEDGVQWTALWYRNGQLVNFETKPWDGGSGGSGYSDWAPRAEEWLPGDYQVQIFIGLSWLRVGFFSVQGNPPTPTMTPTRTPTETPTPTSTYTKTPVPTNTNTPSRTPRPTNTITPSRTPWPTQTRTYTPIPTATGPSPTSTISNTPGVDGSDSVSTGATSTRTPWPTLTRTITPTPSNTAPTSTPTSSRTLWPTMTRTITPIPSATIPTKTPTPTLTRRPTGTPITPTVTITRKPLATPMTPTPTITKQPWPTIEVPSPAITLPETEPILPPQFLILKLITLFPEYYVWFSVYPY